KIANSLNQNEMLKCFLRSEYCKKYALGFSPQIPSFLLTKQIRMVSIAYSLKLWYMLAIINLKTISN
ncbi:TPA: hypothetical protein ACQM6C_001678, partial [Streptococcus pyogenes]